MCNTAEVDARAAYIVMYELCAVEQESNSLKSSSDAILHQEQGSEPFLPENDSGNRMLVKECGAEDSSKQ
jgi:hypothetical protein